jgi:hypothetical protein
MKKPISPLRWKTCCADSQTGTKSTPRAYLRRKGKNPMRLLLFLILLVVYWPAALIVLVLYPFVWLLSLPFRIIGITMDGVFGLLRAILTLPARVLRAV